MPGIKLSNQAVVQGLRGKDKAGMFPGYRPDEPDNLGGFISISEPDKCLPLVEVLYDTDFAAVASTVSKRDELIELARGLIKITGDLPSANAIINGVNLIAQGIDAAIDTRSATATHEFKFTPTVCDPPQEVTVTFEVIATSQVLDADRTDDEEAAMITLTLSTLGDTKTDTFTNKKDFDYPVPLNAGGRPARIVIGPKCVSALTVYAKLDAFCKTDGRSFGRSSASIVKVDAVKITLEAVPCPKRTTDETEEPKPPKPPREERPKQPKERQPGG